jgi:hypothetical protein
VNGSADNSTGGAVVVVVVATVVLLASVVVVAAAAVVVVGSVVVGAALTAEVAEVRAWPAEQAARATEAPAARNMRREIGCT